MEKSPKDFNPLLLVVFLVVLSIGGLFFAGFSWFNALKIPFIAHSGLNQNNNINFSLEDSDAANLLAMQNQDTDQDGLSDYDESYVYKTSAYIADSDSDGFKDGEEVKNNQDPNCPVGQDCGNLLPAGRPAAANLLEDLDNLTPEQIRDILISAGISEADLKNINDNTLRQLYEETLREAQGQTGSASQNQNFAELNPDNLEVLSGAQLRALLKEQGIADDQIKDLSDEELQSLWSEVLKEQPSQ